MCDLIEAVTCPDCKESHKAHIEDVITRWMLFRVRPCFVCDQFSSVNSVITVAYDMISIGEDG